MKTTTETIRVLVARSLEALDDGCDDVRECDTLKEAKEFARHALTEDYQRSGEFSEPMNVTRVMRGDECVAEFYRKGWTPLTAEDAASVEKIRSELVGWGLQIPADKAREIFAGKREYYDEIDACGFDTAARERAFDIVARWLCGLAWPCNGDSEETQREFARKMRPAMKRHGIAFTDRT